jgi:hypothetical protein
MEITQGLQDGHGADKGVSMNAGLTWVFSDFETCEKINVSYSRVRLPAR